jgi:primosomal protein N'
MNNPNATILSLNNWQRVSSLIDKTLYITGTISNNLQDIFLNKKFNVLAQNELNLRKDLNMNPYKIVVIITIKYTPEIQNIANATNIELQGPINIQGCMQYMLKSNNNNYIWEFINKLSKCTNIIKIQRLLD